MDTNQQYLDRIWARLNETGNGRFRALVMTTMSEVLKELEREAFNRGHSIGYQEGFDAGLDYSVSCENI